MPVSGSCKPAAAGNSPRREADVEPRRDSISIKRSSDVLDHATSKIAIGCKLGIAATKNLPAEVFRRPWPSPIKMDAAVKTKVEKLLNL